MVEDGTPLGVKKIRDLGVFGVTTFFSLAAYAWVYYCLMDGIVEPFEAYITFALFFALIFLAYAVDKCNQMREKKRKDEKIGSEHSLKSLKVSKVTDIDMDKSALKYDYLEFYNFLIPLQIGTTDLADSEAQRKHDSMKRYLMDEF